MYITSLVSILQYTVAGSGSAAGAGVTASALILRMLLLLLMLLHLHLMHRNLYRNWLSHHYGTATIIIIIAIAR
jgi:hypothetical protein